MNDSQNSDHGVTGTPEPEGTGDERETRSSAHDEAERTEAAQQSADGTPTENLGAEQPPADGGDRPTVELPTAHTLPHRTGPTPAHYVNQADNASDAEAQDPYATMGQDGYAAQQPTAQQPTAQYPAGQNPYGQNPYAQGQYGAQGQAPQSTFAQQPYGHNPYGQNPYGQNPYNQSPYGQNPYAPNGYGQVPPAFGKKPSRKPKRWMVYTGAAVAAIIVAGGVGGGAFALGHSTGEQAAAGAAQKQTLQIPGGSGSGGSSGTFGTPGGGTGTYGGGSDGSGSGTGTVPADATAATSAEKAGLVTIVSTISYDESSKSAGTGMIMTSNGEILTNNHVVQGATSIQVTDESTGKSYTADVVGTDATNDVAVLKLRNASGLTTVSFDKKTKVATGDTVHSTGNAEGTGNLVTAKGTILGTNQSINVQSESGSGTESLSNLIEISADVVSGDSGGPLRNASGKVVGIVTAASSGTSDVTGYAIPISSALNVADKILAGESSSTIVIGLPAFLGAEIAPAGSGTGDGTGTGGGTGTTTGGVTIAGTVTGSAAAKAGLTAGDTITAIDGTDIPDSTTLTSTIQSHKVGDQVKVTYTDAAGASHTVTVTLGSGPAA